MNKKDNKKKIIIIGIISAFLIVGLTWFFIWGSGAKKEKEIDSHKPTPTIAQIELDSEEEPIVELDINSDRSGATLIVSNISSKFDQLEYELIYLAESDGQEIERGVAGGPLEVSSNRKIKETLLFGTESCTTGVCKRHIDKNVSQGTLIIRLITSSNQVWDLEKDFTIEKVSGGYEAVWQE